MERALVVALRSRHVDAVTAAEHGTVNKDDEHHLQMAAQGGRALYSFNVSDFQSLHQRWISRGWAHAGIILARQQTLTVGEQLGRLLRIVDELTAEEMTSRLEFLASWKR